jgi:hypothetical protein
MTNLTEMVDWLRSTVRGDLEKARAATPGPWSVNSKDLAETIYGADHVAVVAGSRWGGEAPVFESDADAIHIATHDPGDTIARCETELAILNEHAPQGRMCCRICTAPELEIHGDGGAVWEHTPVANPCRTVQLLGYGYRHRDGWKERWRP